MSQVTKTINGVCYESSGRTGVRAAIGDYILVTKPHMFHYGYERGDVLHVRRVNGSSVKAHRLDGRECTVLFDNEYEILRPVAATTCDTVTIDGTTYRKVKRGARPGEKILIVAAEVTFGDYKNGDVRTVREYAWHTTDGIKNVHVHEHTRCIFAREYVVLEPVTTSFVGIVADDRKRITALETEVATLKSRVSTLESAAAKPVTFTHDIRINVSTPTIKSAQQRRDELIRDAIADWDELVAIGGDNKRDLPHGSPWWGHFYHVIDVVVDRDARTVTVTVSSGRSATCSFVGSKLPSTATAYITSGVFNEHLAKIIALRKALGIEIPAKYTDNVPQPEGKRVGDHIRYNTLTCGEIVGEIMPKGVWCTPKDRTCQLGSLYASIGVLVDDSARYL